MTTIKQKSSVDFTILVLQMGEFSLTFEVFISGYNK